MPALAQSGIRNAAAPVATPTVLTVDGPKGSTRGG